MNIHIRAAQFKQFLNLLARKRPGTRWAEHPFSQCQLLKWLRVPLRCGFASRRSARRRRALSRALRRSHRLTLRHITASSNTSTTTKLILMIIRRSRARQRARFTRLGRVSRRRALSGKRPTCRAAAEVRAEVCGATADFLTCLFVYVCLSFLVKTRKQLLTFSPLRWRGKS